MKWKKRICIWVILSISLQCSILFYINHYFLNTDSKATTKRVSLDKNKQTKKININVPVDAERILVSYDAKYLSYYENGELKIVNCEDGSIKSIEGEEKDKIYFCQWLPDRNRMLLIEKKSDNESSKSVLYFYDTSEGKKEKIINLALADIKAEVDDIQLSILTGVIYVKASSDGEQSNIYRIERMKHITRVNTIPKYVSNMLLTRREDNLVYEGSVYNKIYATRLKESISIEGIDKLTLIGSDDDDNMYVGELKNGLVSKIYYGKTSEDTTKWKSFDLKEPTLKDNLFVSSIGKVYQNDAPKGALMEINSGTETKYEGKLLGLYSDGVVYLANNKISFVTFK